MKISAIIPAYNSQAYILDAINSIQQQTYPVDEIIVIDDGSTDKTQEIVSQHPYPVRYIKQQNQGPSSARNKGIELAQGDWIAFLDADDQWTKDKIEKQLNTLSRYPELHLIAGDMQEIDTHNNIITQSVLSKHGFLKKFQLLQGQPIQNALIELLNKNFIPTGTVLIRRSTLVEIGMFNTAIRFGEDLELWSKVAMQYPISCIPDILMLRRLHDSNASKCTDLMLKDLVKVTQSIQTDIETQPKKHAIDMASYVCNAWNDLGYWYFNNNEVPLAKTTFINSIKEKLNKRALLYLLITLLPTQLRNYLRKIKNNLFD